MAQPNTGSIVPLMERNVFSYPCTYAAMHEMSALSGASPGNADFDDYTATQIGALPAGTVQHGAPRLTCPRSGTSPAAQPPSESAAPAAPQGCREPSHRKSLQIFGRPGGWPAPDTDTRTPSTTPSGRLIELPSDFGTYSPPTPAERRWRPIPRLPAVIS